MAEITWAAGPYHTNNARHLSGGAVQTPCGFAIIWEFDAWDGRRFDLPKPPRMQVMALNHIPNLDSAKTSLAEAFDTLDREPEACEYVYAMGR